MNDSESVHAGTIMVSAGSHTDVGLVRQVNEDSLLAEFPIYLVADGMGGHQAGEVASAIVVEEFARLVGRDNLAVEDLHEALEEAGDRIGMISQDSDERAAGTTVTMVVATRLHGRGYWIVMNLGDSRVYRFADESLEQVSIDHSVVQELIERGELSVTGARTHPYRHMVTRALGAGPAQMPDYWTIPAEKGDRLLVCSDGLTGEVEDSIIEEVLAEIEDPQLAAETLVELALKNGGRDNISVVIADATDVILAESASTATALTSIVDAEHLE
ncbi:serine/threonine-protein phosphatase [Micrococcales bacterium 31B]|nr:serine/threonine-protein phosphatase [Micrococcales bacterium 31B]